MRRSVRRNRRKQNAATDLAHISVSDDNDNDNDNDNASTRDPIGFRVISIDHHTFNPPPPP
jgi:nanoRNase/pAp phosphatase (c-di-AMP/oligoRNAs hydrolase)